VSEHTRERYGFRCSRRWLAEGNATDKNLRNVLDMINEGLKWGRTGLLKGTLDIGYVEVHLSYNEVAMNLFLDLRTDNQQQ
jgi:hypothetical protein